MNRAPIIILLSVSLHGCGVGDAAPAGPDGNMLDADAQIVPTTGQTATGEADLEPDPATGSITATIEIEDAPPGLHGVHIHEFGNCGHDAMDAGGHWNPGGYEHGIPGDSPSHLGDLGNMTVADDGTGSLIYSNPGWTLEDGSETDVIGKAIVFHELVDDFGQPTGNAGARIACGVINEDPD